MPSALEFERGVSLHERETLPKSVSLSTSSPITGEAYKRMHPEDFAKDACGLCMTPLPVNLQIEPKASTINLTKKLLNKSFDLQPNHQMAQKEPLKK